MIATLARSPYLPATTIQTVPDFHGDPWVFGGTLKQPSIFKRTPDRLASWRSTHCTFIMKCGGRSIECTNESELMPGLGCRNRHYGVESGPWFCCLRRFPMNKRLNYGNGLCPVFMVCAGLRREVEGEKERRREGEKERKKVTCSRGRLNCRE